MARSQQAIVDYLSDLAHAMWSATDDAIAVLRGLASVLIDSEETVEELKEQTFRQTADSDHLDAVAENRGADRYPWESDEAFRDHAIFKPRGAAPSVLRREIQRLIHHEGYSIEIVEPGDAVALTGDEQDVTNGGMFVGQSMAFSGDGPTRIFWVRLPIVEQSRVRSAYAGQLYASVDGYVDCQPENTRRRLYQHIDAVIDDHRPHAGASGITIDDTPELAHYNHLFEMQGSI